MSAAGRRRPGEKLPPPAKTNHTSPSCNPCLDDRACASPVQPLTSPRRTLDACLATVTRRVRCPLAGYTAIILMLKSDPNPNLTGRLHGHHPGLCPRPSVLCRAAHPQRRQRQRSEHGEPPHPSHTLACLPCVGRVWWRGGGSGAYVASPYGLRPTQHSHRPSPVLAEPVAQGLRAALLRHWWSPWSGRDPDRGGGRHQPQGWGAAIYRRVIIGMTNMVAAWTHTRLCSGLQALLKCGHSRV